MTTKAHGKKYLEVAKLVDSDKLYAPQEAVSLLKKINYVKFDPTVEVHMKLGVDPRHADQMVRGVAMLPAGTGKEGKVLVFAQGEKASEAQAAGADFVGLDDLMKQINEGWLGFHENLAAAIDAIVRAKPTGAKGQYVRSVTICSTMSPGVRLDLQPALGMKT